MAVDARNKPTDQTDAELMSYYLTIWAFASVFRR